MSRGAPDVVEAKAPIQQESKTRTGIQTKPVSPRPATKAMQAKASVPPDDASEVSSLSNAAMAYLEEAKASARKESAGPTTSNQPIPAAASLRPVKGSSPEKGAAMTSPGRSSILSFSEIDPESAREPPPTGSGAVSVTPEWERRLKEIFDQCDSKRQGNFRARDLVKLVLSRVDVAAHFGFPQRALQVDGARDLLEQFFQKMDGNSEGQVSWEELKSFYAKAVVSVSSEARQAAQADARSALEAEIQTRLRDLEKSLASVATEEVRAEVARMTALRGSTKSIGGIKVDFSLPTEQLKSKLQSELASAKERAQSLWAAIEAQQSRRRNTPEDLELAEARREGNTFETTIARAQEEAQASQSHARQLDTLNGRLQKDLQAAKAALEERRNDKSIVEESKAADECKELRLFASRLEAEALRSAEATETICNRSKEMEVSIDRMQSEKEAALAITKEHDTQREALWGRLASLASVRGGAPPADSSLSDLVDIIAKEWTEARRLHEWSQRNSILVQQRRRELEAQLDIAREAGSRAAMKREAAASDFESKDRDRRTRSRRAADDLASAEAENTLLVENRLEWTRTRPQLEQLIEELRIGSHESKGAAQSLADRLTSLRKAIDIQRLGNAYESSVAPSSPMSPPRALTRDRSGDKSSDLDDSPVVKAGGEMARNFVELALDSPGPSTPQTSESLAVPHGARDSPDPLVRKAAEESDLLHKRVLALEDEKASLIRSQEELIQFIREKVEPVQKALDC